VSDVAPQPRPVAAATRMTRNGRRRQPKIQADWPWAADIVTLGISDGPHKGQTVTLRQVTRRVPARHGTRQIRHADLPHRPDLRGGVLAHVVAVARRELLPLRPHPVRPGLRSPEGEDPHLF
jgi:hypothetical protein